MRPSQKPISLQRLDYARAAEAYLKGLPPEHFMESTPQAQQRKITLASLDLVSARRPDVQLFNELLVQYLIGREETLRQVVPDNMVVVHDQPIKAKGSFDAPLQPAPPFWVMEYISKGSERKDYEDSYAKYEKELKVPYYLTFYPDEQELTLYHRNRSRYVSVKPNANGRLLIAELEIEIAILDEWARYWFRGELLPLTAELQAAVDKWKQRAVNAEQRLEHLEALLRRHGIDPDKQPQDS